MQSIYALHDTVAKELHGNLIRFRHDAAAVRLFTELLTNTDNPVGRHPQDFELVHLGYINVGEEGQNPFQLVDDYSVILTGSAWVAAQQSTHKQPEANNNGR